MTQDEIIEMAREAGYRFADDTDQRMANHGQWQRNLLEAFAKLVEERTAAKERADEREACAQVAFSWNTVMTDLVAKEIRARGTEA